MRSINSSNHHDRSTERALEYSFSTETRPSTRACLWLCKNRARISQTWATIKHHGHATWLWSSPPKQHGACDTPVFNTCGRTY
ncbi:hypothetical protein GOBAR_AA06915 [Gossypium barbadense]|uniref:Uncharacterized protein n=1 Tax=Gossypium barbadense TaxID=3634 RepID=A0A2P5YDI3_GOSBA|nr:hypothetical protein GOBAR_AA06915 [Gossypium barbadense]